MTRRVLIGIWLSLIVLEVAASSLAYWTLGWLDSFFFFLCVLFLNVFALGIAWIKIWPGLILASCCGLPFIGYQATLALKWWFVSSEAQRVVEWVYSEQRRTGSLPEDLREYVLRHPEYKDIIGYEEWMELEGTKWGVSYTVGSKSTYYSYTPEFGWFYHDD